MSYCSSDLFHQNVTIFLKNFDEKLLRPEVTQSKAM